MLVVVAGVLWWSASIPWELSPAHVIPFIAPAAILSLAIGWALHATTRNRWTWDISLRWITIGGMIGAPLLTLYIPLVGDLRPDRMLAHFVWLAWFAIGLGALMAIVGALASRGTSVRQSLTR